MIEWRLTKHTMAVFIDFSATRLKCTIVITNCTMSIVNFAPFCILLDKMKVDDVLYQNFVFWNNPPTKTSAIASDWPTYFELLCNECNEENLTKINPKLVLNALYQVCVFRPGLSSTKTILASDYISFYVSIFSSALAERSLTTLGRKQILNVLYHINILHADLRTK